MPVSLLNPKRNLKDSKSKSQNKILSRNQVELTMLQPPKRTILQLLNTKFKNKSLPMIAKLLITWKKLIQHHRWSLLSPLKFLIKNHNLNWKLRIVSSRTIRICKEEESDILKCLLHTKHPHLRSQTWELQDNKIDLRCKLKVEWTNHNSWVDNKLLSKWEESMVHTAKPSHLSPTKCLTAWASLTLLNSCILRAWCQLARREGGIESVQRPLNSWCKNTSRIHPGAKRLTKELQGSLVFQTLKYTNGAGTKRTRKLKMASLTKLLSRMMTSKILMITKLQPKPSKTQLPVLLSAKVTSTSMKKLKMESYFLIKCTETRRKRMDL